MITKDTSNISIVAYQPHMKHWVRELNYEWLQHYFSVEPGDVTVLNNPEQLIIAKGGHIFFASIDDRVVGTVSLLKISDKVFELGKMAVTQSARNLGIGTRLLEHCIAFAKQQGIQELVLFSNTCLQPAIHLYRKYGFEEIPLQQGIYKRANIKMRLLL